MTQDGQVPDTCRRPVFGDIINVARMFFWGCCSRANFHHVRQMEYLSKRLNTRQKSWERGRARLETGQRQYHSMPTDDLYPRSDARGSSRWRKVGR